MSWRLNRDTLSFLFLHEIRVYRRFGVSYCHHLQRIRICPSSRSVCINFCHSVLSACLAYYSTFKLETVLWQVNPLLIRNRHISTAKTELQQWGSVFCVVRAGQFNGVELVSQQVRGPLRFSRCELFMWKVGSWGRWTIREPRGRGTLAVGSRYQATTSVDVTVETNVCVCVCVSVRNSEL
jgi:hypothetical protein